MANDTGGAVTQFALDEDPRFVSRLVFTNCDAFDLFPPQPFRLYFALMRHRLLLKPLVEAMRLKTLRHSPPLGVGLLLDDPPDPRADRVGLRSPPSERRTNPRGLHRVPAEDQPGGTRHGDRPHVAVDLPVRFVWGGRDDRCFTLDHGRRFAEVFPGPDGEGARFVEIPPDARTFVSLDQPQAVASEIAAFTTEASKR